MNKDSKQIYIRQNEPKMLELLHAASDCYHKGKLLCIPLGICAFVIPIVINILFLFFSGKVLSTVSLVVTLLCFGICELLNYSIVTYKIYGSNLQQRFDEHVFDLNGPSSSIVKRIGEDKVLDLLTLKRCKRKQTFENWYSDYSALPYEHAVLMCQKENIRWDNKLRRKYCKLLFIVGSLLTIGIIINACFRKDDLYALFVVLSSFAPLITFLYHGIKNLILDIKAQNSLATMTTSLDNSISHGESIEGELLELQTEVFYYRQHYYMIPDWFYSLSRSSMQEAEDMRAERIKAEVKVHETDDKE